MVPFHDLWIDGGETEKRPSCPQRIIGSVKKNEAISETRHWPLSYQVKMYYKGIEDYESNRRTHRERNKSFTKPSWYCFECFSNAPQMDRGLNR